MSLLCVSHMHFSSRHEVKTKWYGSVHFEFHFFCNYTRSKSDRVWRDSLKFKNIQYRNRFKWPEKTFVGLSRQTADCFSSFFFIFFNFGWCQTEIDSESPGNIVMTGVLLLRFKFPYYFVFMSVGGVWKWRHRTFFDFLSGSCRVFQ